MSTDYEELSKKVTEALKNITQEEIDEYFPPDTTPKGWLSIEEYLPKCEAQGRLCYQVPSFLPAWRKEYRKTCRCRRTAWK